MSKNNKKNNKNSKKNNRVDLKSTHRKKNFSFDNEIVIGINSEKADARKDKQIKKKKNNKKKFSNINKKKKKKRNYRFPWKLFLFIILLVGIAVFLFLSPVFNVGKIEINGNEKVTVDRIESLSQISLNVNIFKYSKSKIIKNLKEEPYIGSVEIKRKLPNKIQINIEERKPYYIVNYSENYIYLDSQGYILEISNEKIEVPELTGIKTKQESLIPGNRLQEEDLEKINNILKLMETATNNEINSKISSIDFTDDNDYILKINDEGKIVHFGDLSNINDKILMLKEVLIKEAGNSGEIFVKDLNKVYFRQNN